MLENNTTSEDANAGEEILPPSAGGSLARSVGTSVAVPETDPERIAYNLWNEGRVDEAIQFLDREIAARRHGQLRRRLVGGPFPPQAERNPAGVRLARPAPRRSCRGFQRLRRGGVDAGAVGATGGRDRAASAEAPFPRGVDHGTLPGGGGTFRRCANVERSYWRIRRHGSSRHAGGPRGRSRSDRARDGRR